jgi:hypothetical protein
MLITLEPGPNFAQSMLIIGRAKCWNRSENQQEAGKDGKIRFCCRTFSAFAQEERQHPLYLPVLRVFLFNFPATTAL